MEYLLYIIAFALGFPVSYFIWDKALKRKKNKMMKKKK